MLVSGRGLTVLVLVVGSSQLQDFLLFLGRRVDDILLGIVRHLSPALRGLIRDAVGDVQASRCHQHWNSWI